MESISFQEIWTRLQVRADDTSIQTRASERTWFWVTRVRPLLISKQLVPWFTIIYMHYIKLRHAFMFLVHKSSQNGPWTRMFQWNSYLPIGRPSEASVQFCLNVQYQAPYSRKNIKTCLELKEDWSSPGQRREDSKLPPKSSWLDPLVLEIYRNSLSIWNIWQRKGGCHSKYNAFSIRKRV